MSQVFQRVPTNKNVSVDTENVTVIPSMTMNPGEQQIIIGDGGETQDSPIKNLDSKSDRSIPVVDDLDVNLAHFDRE